MKKEQFSSEEIREKYNSFGKWYDLAEIFNNLLTGRYRKRLLRNAKGKVLEVGIGSGVNLKYYSNKCEIVGVDLSKEMLKKAKKKADKLRIKVQLKEGDAENLPFKKRSFDYVVDALCLCTYSNPIKALREMKRVCKNNGKILLLEHGASNNNFIKKLQEKRKEKHYEKIGCHLTRNPEKLVRKAGLKIEMIERKVFGIFYLIVAKL